MVGSIGHIQGENCLTFIQATPLHSNQKYTINLNQRKGQYNKNRMRSICLISFNQYRGTFIQECIFSFLLFPPPMPPYFLLLFLIISPPHLFKRIKCDINLSNPDTTPSHHKTPRTGQQEYRSKKTRRKSTRKALVSHKRWKKKKWRNLIPPYRQIGTACRLFPIT